MGEEVSTGFEYCGKLQHNVSTEIKRIKLVFKK